MGFRGEHRPCVITLALALALPRDDTTITLGISCLIADVGAGCLLIPLRRLDVAACVHTPGI